MARQVPTVRSTATPTWCSCSSVTTRWTPSATSSSARTAPLLTRRDGHINISPSVGLWERSQRPRSRECPVIRRPLAVAAATVLLTALAAAPAYADEVEQVVNGGFDAGTEPWYSSAGAPITLDDGRACVDVPGGTVNRWDVTHRAERHRPGRGGVVPLLVLRLRQPGRARRPRRGRAVGRAVRHVLRGVARGERLGGQLLVHVHRRGQHRAGPGGAAGRRQPGPVAVLPGRRVAARRCAARGLRAGHRPAGPGQPGRLPAGRAEERHRRHRGGHDPLPWELRNAPRDRRRPRHDRAARRGRLVRSERAVGRLRPVPAAGARASRWSRTARRAGRSTSGPRRTSSCAPTR